jgi:hypothetical protein
MSSQLHPHATDPFRGWDQPDGSERPAPPTELISGPGENATSPRFVALVGDDFLEADQSLTALLHALRDHRSTDVCIWDTVADRVAALLRRGRVLKFTNEPPTPAPNGHARGKGKSRKHGPDFAFARPERPAGG